MKPRLFAAAVLALTAGATVVADTDPVNAQVAAAPSGETVFKQRCAACHTATTGAPNRVGPNLAGVVGRKAGAVAGFNYSPALRKSNLVWNKANLDRYLTAPQKMVPGTRMSVSLPDARQRTALVTYLEKAK